MASIHTKSNRAAKVKVPASLKRDATARMRFAAPDLYNALKEMRSAGLYLAGSMAQCAPPQLQKIALEKFTAAHERASLALAKADGKS